MMYLEIVFGRDFDPAVFAGFTHRRRGNTITARGTREEMLGIIRAADTIFCDKTIIFREEKDESQETQQGET